MTEINITINTADKSDQQSWDEYALNHPKGSAYHQFAWKISIEKAYGFKGIYLQATQESRVRGIFPLIVFKSFISGNKLVSLPYCDVGGPLADNENIESMLIREALKVGDSTCLEIRSDTSPDENHTDYSSDSKVRMILELPGHSDALMDGFKSKLRSQVNKPIRDGLSTRLGNSELLDDFYFIFSTNMKALGSPVHSKKWFREIITNYDERIRIGVVDLPDGTPVAAGVILLHNKTISIPWASSLKNYNRMNPNVLLYWSFLKFAADNGFEQFDFGRSTPGEGTYRFKEQWGAEPRPLYWYRMERGGPTEIIKSQNANGTARKVFEKFWPYFPLPICNLVGPKIRRGIDL